MEQVAEALKQLKSNGEWGKDVINIIGSEIYKNSDEFLSVSEIEAVLNAIIEIFDTN